MLIRITRLTEIYLEHTYVVIEINEQAQATIVSNLNSNLIGDEHNKLQSTVPTR